MAVWLRASLQMLPSSPWRGDNFSSPMWCLQSPTRRRRTCSRTRSSRRALFSLLRLWRLLALRLVTCPCLSHIFRPPCRRLHLVVHHILALRPREALLDNFLDNLLRSDPLPLSDCSLARRAIRASGRSPPETGRFFGSKSLVPLWRSAAA